jgi:hypothetical protein
VVEHLGDITYLYVETSRYATPLMMRVPADAPYCVGEDIKLTLPRGQCYVFDQNGMRLAPDTSVETPRLRSISA